MRISDAEWIVMNVIWDAASVEASDAIERLAVANGWSAATVKTMLHRLVRKGALATESHGKKYVYRPAVRRDDCVREESRSFLDRVFGGDAVPALLHFATIAKLSPKEAAELRAILDAREAESSREGTRK